MNRRCTDHTSKNYRTYAGRGIKICSQWQSFEVFLADMGPKPSPRHSIDRIDNDGNYEPGNCRWATSQQQCANRRAPYKMEARIKELEAKLMLYKIKFGSLEEYIAS